MRHRIDAERHHPEVMVTATGVRDNLEASLAGHDETPYEHEIRAEYGDLDHAYDENEKQNEENLYFEGVHHEVVHHEAAHLDMVPSYQELLSYYQEGHQHHEVAHEIAHEVAHKIAHEIAHE